MAEPGVVRRIFIPFTLLLVTGLGFINTYGDPTEVKKLAADTACGGTICEPQLREFSRNPLAHEYTYQVGKAASMVTVRCARTAILVGEYRCEKK